VAELITWCRIMRTGPACAVPCDDCRATSRRLALAQQAGTVKPWTLADAIAELDGTDPRPTTDTTEGAP
jgi:hypothetical protein